MFAVAVRLRAEYLELGPRVENGLEEPRFTTEMITKANDEVRNPTAPEPAPIPPRILVSQILVVPSGLIAGVFGSYLNSWWQWVGLAIFGVIAIISQIYALVALRRPQ